MLDGLRVLDLADARGYLCGRTLRFPGSFGLFDGHRPVVRRLAPALGEHTDEVLCEWLGL